MRKRRGWLIGLGLGLMLGAGMLQLMNAARSMSESGPLATASISQEQLEQEAADRGFRLVGNDEETYTKEQLDAAVAAAKQEAEKAAASADRPSGGGAASEPVKEYDLYVRPNASLQEVANALEAMGLIDDKAAFIRLAKPYSGKLRVGLCRFAGKPTPEDIVAELTRAKN